MLLFYESSPPQFPRKDFCRAKMTCGGERLSGLLLGSLIVVRNANQFAIAIQKESAGKNRRSARQGRHCLTRTTGIAQGSADPCVFTRQRKKQLLRGGSTPRFFAQLRSVGSNYPAGRSLPESHWSLDHRSSQNLPRRPAGAKIPRFPGGTLNASHAETPDSGLRPFGYRRHDRRCSIARAGSDTKNSAFRCIRQARTHSPAGFPDRIPHSRSAG